MHTHNAHAHTQTDTIQYSTNGLNAYLLYLEKRYSSLSICAHSHSRIS